MVIFFFLVVLALCFFFFFVNKKLEISGQYRPVAFMSPAEIKFFQALHGFIGSRAQILAKVRLADLAQPTAAYRSSAWRIAFNRIQSKHVDFALSDLNGRILCCIELDDSSHAKVSRQERDGFVDRCLQEAKLTVYHVPVRGSYSAADFKMLDKVLI